MTPEILTPEDIIRSLEAGLLAERKRHSEAARAAQITADRIRKAEKLLRQIRATFDISAPAPIVTEVRTKPKPEGIEVIDPRLECPECGFVASGPTGLARHASTRHGLSWVDVRARQAAAQSGAIR